MPVIRYGPEDNGSAAGRRTNWVSAVSMVEIGRAEAESGSAPIEQRLGAYERAICRRYAPGTVAEPVIGRDFARPVLSGLRINATRSALVHLTATRTAGTISGGGFGFDDGGAEQGVAGLQVVQRVNRHFAPAAEEGCASCRAACKHPTMMWGFASELSRATSPTAVTRALTKTTSCPREA